MLRMLNVIYEDNHLLVVEKTVNIPVQEDRSGDLDLLRIAKNYLIEKYNKPGDAYLGLVHRLDRPVSGVMVFAKTSKAASRLSNQLRLHQIERTYLAVVAGKLSNKSGKMVDYLIKDRQTNTSRVTHKNERGAKKAILHYEVLAERDDMSLIKVHLETGRSHQIRVQLSDAGHPIIGDQKYGEAVSKPGTQISLWAFELALKHPTKKDDMHFNSTPPSTFPWNEFSQYL